MMLKKSLYDIDETKGLLDALEDGAPSLPSPSTTNQNSNQPNSESSGIETYQLPVSGKPWLVGFFSPGVATDKNHPQGHNGVDMKANRGTSVYPIASGIVKGVGSSGKSGNYVICLHENGGVQSFYGHLDSTSVQVNQKIDQKTTIGTIGDSGNAKGRGCHCHYEVKINGSLTNPLNIVGKTVGSLSKKANLIQLIIKLSNEFEKLTNKRYYA